MPRTTKHTKEQITGLISLYGSAYKAACALNITPSAFYDQMRTHGIKPTGYALLPGEPKARSRKKTWLKVIITNNGSNLNAVAKELGVTRSAVESRMVTYGITIKRKSKQERQREFTKVFVTQDGKVSAVAKVLGVTPAAVYDRARRYKLVTQR